MLTRAISGAVFVVLMVGAIYYHPYTLFALFAFCTTVGMHELLKALEGDANHNPLKFFFIIVGLIGYAIYASTSLDLMGSWGYNVLYSYAYPSIPVLIFVPFIIILFSKSAKPEQSLAHGFLALIYVALPFALLSRWTIPLRGIEYDPNYLLSGLALIWTNDTFAYLTGRWLGKTKLFERVSPNKTWEGTIGGIFFAGLVAAILGHFQEGGYWVWAGFGIVCALSAIIGDLIESRLKRSLGVKDMGNVMPGHGGILDRFDALLLASPMGLVYIHYFFR